MVFKKSVTLKTHKKMGMVKYNFSEAMISRPKA